MNISLKLILYKSFYTKSLFQYVRLKYDCHSKKSKNCIHLRYKEVVLKCM